MHTLAHDYRRCMMLARVRNVAIGTSDPSDYQICFRDSVSAVNVKI